MQNAYSVLSDPHERAWYDEHREAILRGGVSRAAARSSRSRGPTAAHPAPIGASQDGTANGEGSESAAAAHEVNLWPYFTCGRRGLCRAPAAAADAAAPLHRPSCYRSFDAEDQAGFWAVYEAAFERVTETERAGSSTPRDPPRFGGPDTPWPQVSAFYQYWDSFVSNLSFAWRDVWNPREVRVSRTHAP